MLKTITSSRFIISTFIIAVFYVLLTVYLMNARLVADTIFGIYPFSYKYTLLTALLGGMWTAMTRDSLIILVFTAILTGANLMLLLQKIANLKASGKIHLVVGGSTFLGIVGSGCAACGLPLLALFGLTGSALYLPFQGREIAYIALGLLIFSTYLMIKSEQDAKVCRVNTVVVR